MADDETIMADDENGDTLHTFEHNGCYIIVAGPIDESEERLLKAFIDQCRADGLSPARITAALSNEQFNL